MQQNLVQALAAAAVLLIIAKVIYVLYFHPLAKYPGPFLAKFTHAYSAYYAWKGDSHIDIWRCHEKYGPALRYGPSQVFFNTPSGFRDIYGSKASTRFLKSDHYNVLTHNTPSTFTHRGGQEHLRRRRILAQGMSTQAQRDYEPRIKAHIDKLCDIIMPEQEEGHHGFGRAFNMAEWTSYLSFDMMADIVFGAKYNLLGEERFRYVIEMAELSNVRIATLVQMPGLAFAKLDRYLFRHAIYARNRFLKFVMRLTHDRRQLSAGRVCGIYEKTHADGVRPQDICSKLENAKDPETGREFNLDEIASETITLIIAGSDTTSCTMSSLLFYLADNPRAYERVAAEVRAHCASRDAISGITLAPCVYLRACIDEALRMSPPVGTALAREVREPGTVVDGEVIPVGYDTGVGSYALHHNKDVFPDPFVFRPERWLESEVGADSVKQARACFAPFSAGIRSCLGKGLAYTKTTLTLATLLYLGDFKFAKGDLGNIGRGHQGAVPGRQCNREFQTWDYIAGQKNGPYLQFTRRSVE